MTARSIDEIVEREVRRWELQRRRAARDEVPLHQRPMITMSRSLGSRGDEIAARAAAALGYRVYDRELVERIAEREGVRLALAESVDERVRGRLQRWIGGAFASGQLVESDYLRALTEVLLALGQHGDAIIIGRGAHLVLDPAWTLRLRVSAPLESRVRVVAATQGIGEDEARERVLAVDRERAGFGWHHFRRDILAPELFDLVLNTGSLSVERCADLIVEEQRRRLAQPSGLPLAPQPPPH